MHIHECIIIWAGPAGIWTALKLEELWIESIILEGKHIWSSFSKWNSQTRFISPSFPGNAFGQVDLNSIHYSTSPWLMFKKEHMSWIEYTEYLQSIVQWFSIKVHEHERVLSISKKEDYFELLTENWSTFQCRFLISASWEFHFPHDGNIIGSKYALHSSKVSDYNWYRDAIDIIPIIGWYESSIDAAYGLYKIWKKTHIFCPHEINKTNTSDPSKNLSPYSVERLREMQKQNSVSFTQDFITDIYKEDLLYRLVWKSGEKHIFYQRPILATGFKSGLWYLWDLMSHRPDGMPEINRYDELKKTKNIFIVGPQVRQQETIFCFIYKFRLRFWIIALEIAHRLWKNINFDETQKIWEKQGFFLDDLKNCTDECIC